MNDLPHFLPNVGITMFADDTSFAKAFKGVNEIKEHLVPAFFKICRWLKTELMIIGTPNSICKLDNDLGGIPYLIVVDGDCRIRRVKLVKSLDLTVDYTLTWSNHIDYISGKVKRGVGIIKGTNRYLDSNSLLMPYSTFVKTHVRYCNVIWGKCNETLIDKLHLLQSREEVS